MRKYVMYIGMMLLVALYPMECFATEPQKDAVYTDTVEEVRGQLLYSGYTEDGISYEVYGLPVLTRAVDTVTVERTVVYTGMVNPSRTLNWEEKIDGVFYVGTLSLTQTKYLSGKTTAIYTGTLHRM